MSLDHARSDASAPHSKNNTASFGTGGLLHSRDAARYLGVSEAWLARERWKGAGGPAYVKVGGASGRAIRYLRADLDAWISGNRVDTIQGGRNAR